MSELLDIEGVGGAVRRLESLGVVPGVAAGLRDTLTGQKDQLIETVTHEVPAFSESANPAILPALRQHLAEHLTHVASLLDRSADPNFEFVRRHAEQQAEWKFPLDALLRAYQCLHRQLAVWVRDAALRAADESAQMRRVVAAAGEFANAYVGTIGPLCTARYVEHTRAAAEAEGDRRLALLNTLLDGYDESDARAASLLRRAGYLEQRQSYCVAVARAVRRVEMENPARAQRMRDAVSAALAPTGLRTVVGLRDNLVVAVISGVRRQSGWTAPRALLAERVFPALSKVGPAALIGLSNDVPSTSHIPRAAEEATLALDFASVADRVLPFARIPFRDMLVAQARESSHLTLPAWLDDFQAKDRRGTLGATLKAYADADMNALKAAKQLEIHPNTIYARMQKIEAVTGLSPLKYHNLTEMLLALECVD